MGSSYEACEEAAGWLRGRLRVLPRVGLVCGSGLGALAQELRDPQSFPYADIPHFPPSTVQGHAGQLVVGQVGGTPCAVLQGRFHRYEGLSPAQVVLPVRVLALLGVRVLVLTNAAGALAEGLRPGQLLVLKDHIDLPGLAGGSPLAGPNDERFGPRFPSLRGAYGSHWEFGPRFPSLRGAYDAGLRRLALRLAPPELGARPGVYCGVGGPSYETPAECRMLRRMGAHAVGMSTVSEAAAARHCGLRVLGLSLITNVALEDDDVSDADDDVTDDVTPPADDVTGGGATLTGHDEVLAAAQAGAQHLRRLLSALLPQLEHA